MAKRYAIITRQRQSEAMRMALGLLLLGDEAEVFLADSALGADDATEAQYKNCLEMDVPVYSNHPDAPDTAKLPAEEFTTRLTKFDRLIPLLP